MFCSGIQITLNYDVKKNKHKKKFNIGKNMTVKSKNMTVKGSSCTDSQVIIISWIGFVFLSFVFHATHKTKV